MAGTFDGRIALVTGGASGIGAACVRAFAEAGADVAILYHTREGETGQLVANVEALGRRGVGVQADVADERQVEEAFDEIVQRLGRPTILINSAGLNMTGVRVREMSLDQWQRLVAVDLTGSFLTSRRFVRELGPHGGPATIVNITSVHAFAMRDGASDYDAAKGGQTALTRTLALEVAERGITVNAIAPGMILTPMNQRAIDDLEYRRSLERNIPARRAGYPDEVAKLALYLASPDASYITGAQIVIDGGLSLKQAMNA